MPAAGGKGPADDAFGTDPTLRIPSLSAHFILLEDDTLQEGLVCGNKDELSRKLFAKQRGSFARNLKGRRRRYRRATAGRCILPGSTWCIWDGIEKGPLAGCDFVQSSARLQRQNSAKSSGNDVGLTWLPWMFSIRRANELLVYLQKNPHATLIRRACLSSVTSAKPRRKENTQPQVQLR